MSGKKHTIIRHWNDNGDIRKVRCKKLPFQQNIYIVKASQKQKSEKMSQAQIEVNLTPPLPSFHEAPSDEIMADRLDKWTPISPQDLLQKASVGDWITYSKCLDWKCPQDNKRSTTCVVIKDMSPLSITFTSTPPKKKPAHDDQPRRIFEWSFSWASDSGNEQINEALRGKFHRRNFYVRPEGSGPQVKQGKTASRKRKAPTAAKKAALINAFE